MCVICMTYTYIPKYIHTQAQTVIPTNRKPGFMGLFRYLRYTLSSHFLERWWICALTSMYKSAHLQYASQCLGFSVWCLHKHWDRGEKDASQVYQKPVEPDGAVFSKLRRRRSRTRKLMKLASSDQLSLALGTTLA